MHNETDTNFDRFLKWWKNHFWSSLILVIGVIIISFGAFTDALEKIGRFAKSLPTIFFKEQSVYHQVIPDGEIPPIPSDGSMFVNMTDAPLEIAGITYWKLINMLDIRVRNTSNETLVLNFIYFYVTYTTHLGVILPPTDEIDIGVDSEEVKGALKRREPLSIRRGYKVSYSIDPKGVDRYFFNLNLDLEDLYYPKTHSGGDYNLIIGFSYNSGKLTWGFEKLDRLL